MLQRYCGLSTSVFLLGLFPALFLPVLQLILLIMLVGLIVSYREFDPSALRSLLQWRYLAFAQFYVFFFANAAFYPVWAGTPDHFRGVALESWSVGLLGLVVLGLWLKSKKAADVKDAVIRWLPAGLTLSFLIATAVYIEGSQGPRVHVFTPNALGPPFWFLVLTMASFVWFDEMTPAHRFWRFALFFMAGLMPIYGGARLIMLAWVACGIAMVIWLYFQSASQNRLRVLMGAALMMLLCAGGVMAVEILSGGFLTERMMDFAGVEMTYESLSGKFARAEIWFNALSIISEHGVFGLGQVNERLALTQKIGWEHTFRAHQTYLSYLIAGGIPALISGVLLQSPVLGFLRRTKASIFFPMFLGLGGVVTLNCFTDSIFQSAVSVQVFMVTTLLFLKATDLENRDG